MQSFQEFLRRGTGQQRQQLLRSTLHDIRVIDPSLPPPEAPPLEDRNTNWPSKTPQIGQKRRRSSQQCSPRNSYARKWGAPIPSDTTVCSPSATTSHPSSLASFHPREHNRGRADNGELPIEKDEIVYKSMLEPVKSPQDAYYGIFNNPVVPNLLVGARQFFETRLMSRKNRAPYLVRAVQGFLEAPPLPPEFSKDIWNEKSAIFSKPQVAGSTARFRSLYEGHRKIKRGGEQYLSATRFCYIYLEHDLEQIIASQELVLSQGRGKVTAAFQLQAESISVTMDTLRAERKAGRGYIRLLMEGGPGFVLRMGSNVSTM